MPTLHAYVFVGAPCMGNNLAVQTEYTVKLGGVSELDETFVLDSYKGKKLPENVNRKPRKHGESAQKAGLSKEYVCICTGIERKGAAMALTVNRAKPSSQELQEYSANMFPAILWRCATVCVAMPRWKRPRVAASKTS